MRCWWACHYDIKVRARQQVRSVPRPWDLSWNRGMLTAAGSVEFYEDTGRRWLAENGL